MSNSQEEVTLTRDVIATLIPHGEEFTLGSGEKVTITHRLGGNFTVMTLQGMYSPYRPNSTTEPWLTKKPMCRDSLRDACTFCLQISCVCFCNILFDAPSPPSVRLRAPAPLVSVIFQSLDRWHICHVNLQEQPACAGMPRYTTIHGTATRKAHNRERYKAHPQRNTSAWAKQDA